MQRIASGDLRDLIEAVKDEYRRFDNEVEALDERAVTLDVTGLDTSGSPFKAELTVYPARKSFALRFEGDSNAKRMMKPEDLSNIMPTVKKLWWAKEARVSNTLAEKVAARFLAAARSKQAGWDGKLVGKDFRMTWDQSGIHIEELPAKGKRKLRVAEMLTPFMWTKFDAWLPINLIQHVGKVSASDSYDTAKAKVEAALTDKRTLEWVQKDAAPGVDPLKLLKDYRTQWSERQVHFLQITPENVEPFTADGKDFTVSCEWTKFKAYSPDSDLANPGDPHYSIIVSTAAASARKLYQILKAEPNALRSIPWSKFSDFLRANKVNYEMQHSVWH